MALRRSINNVSNDPIHSVADPLRELFEACRNGDIVKVKKIITRQNVNSRDTTGRKSTALHFAAGMFINSLFEIYVLFKCLFVFKCLVFDVKEIEDWMLLILTILDA